MKRRRPRRPLPVRRAALVWIGCALAGWIVAIVSMYSVLRFGDTLVARIADLANPFASSSEEEGLPGIAPAAGPDAPPAPGGARNP